MASNPPGQCCTIGVKHEGEASGEMGKIGDYETYFAYPKDKSTKNAIVLITDVIGHKFINAQLIADQFAANGYFVVMPDVFYGDPIPLNRPETFDFATWIKPHGKETVDPIVEKCIEELKGKYNAKHIGGVGYCFGAKYVIRYLKKGQIEAVYCAHPSFVDEDELKAIEGPLAISAAETDAIFPAEKRHRSEEILKEVGQPYQIYLYSGVEHGFAVRADINVPHIKHAKEEAFLQGVRWFDQYLLKS